VAKRTRWTTLATLMFVVIAVLAGTGQPASAATGPDGFIILHAGNYDFAHKCEVFGTSGGYQAAVCSDIKTSAPDSSGTYAFWGEVEVYCQTTGGVPQQCTHADAAGALYNGRAYELGITTSWWCGTSAGAPACPTGRIYLTTPVFYSSLNSSQCDASPTGPNTMWMLALAAPFVAVTLPNNTPESLPQNWSTGHYYVCP
jgi:hypothetical protein